VLEKSVEVKQQWLARIQLARSQAIKLQTLGQTFGDERRTMARWLHGPSTLYMIYRSVVPDLQPSSEEFGATLKPQGSSVTLLIYEFIYLFKSYLFYQHGR
jgi:hypothetical protein